MICKTECFRVLQGRGWDKQCRYWRAECCTWNWSYACSVSMHSMWLWYWHLRVNRRIKIQCTFTRLTDRVGKVLGPKYILELPVMSLVIELGVGDKRHVNVRFTSLCLNLFHCKMKHPPGTSSCGIFYVSPWSMQSLLASFLPFQSCAKSINSSFPVVFKLPYVNQNVAWQRRSQKMVGDLQDSFQCQECSLCCSCLCKLKSYLLSLFSSSASVLDGEANHEASKCSVLNLRKFLYL